MSGPSIDQGIEKRRGARLRRAPFFGSSLAGGGVKARQFEEILYDITQVTKAHRFWDGANSLPIALNSILQSPNQIL